MDELQVGLSNVSRILFFKLVAAGAVKATEFYPLDNALHARINNTHAVYLQNVDKQMLQKVLQESEKRHLSFTSHLKKRFNITEECTGTATDSGQPDENWDFLDGHLLTFLDHMEEQAADMQKFPSLTRRGWGPLLRTYFAGCSPKRCTRTNCRGHFLQPLVFCYFSACASGNQSIYLPHPSNRQVPC